MMTEADVFALVSKAQEFDQIKVTSLTFPLNICLIVPFECMLTQAGSFILASVSWISSLKLKFVGK